MGRIEISLGGLRGGGAATPYLPQHLSTTRRRSRFTSCTTISGRIHKTLRVTPAMEAGVSDRVWSLPRSPSLRHEIHPGRLAGHHANRRRVRSDDPCLPPRGSTTPPRRRPAKLRHYPA